MKVVTGTPVMYLDTVSRAEIESKPEPHLAV
jgi:hypothetical protein